MIKTKRFGTELNLSGFPNGEFNMGLEVSATPTPKSNPTDLTSPNPNIKFNSVPNLLGGVQLNKMEKQNG